MDITLDNLSEMSFDAVAELAQKIEKELKTEEDPERKQELENQLSTIEVSLRKREFMNTNKYNVFYLTYITNVPASAVVYQINLDKNKMSKTFLPVVVDNHNGYVKSHIVVGTYPNSVVAVKTGKTYDIYYAFSDSLVYIGNTRDKAIRKLVKDFTNFRYGSMEDMAKLSAEKSKDPKLVMHPFSFIESYNKNKELAWILVNERRKGNMKLSKVINNIVKIFSTGKRSLDDPYFKQSVTMYVNSILAEKNDKKAKEELFKSIDGYIRSLNPNLTI